MKNEHPVTAYSHRKTVTTWAIRIFAILLALLMVGGTAYYTILFLI